jgi:hypothetical protein
MRMAEALFLNICKKNQLLEAKNIASVFYNLIEV